MPYNLSKAPLGLAYNKISISYDEQAKHNKDIFTKELEDLENKRIAYDKSSLSPNQEDKKLKSPYKLRKEMEDIKKNIAAYREYKESFALANKRNRLIKNNWRNGILGVDNIYDIDTVFFKQNQEELLKRGLEKMEINERNNEMALKYKATNPGVEINNPAFLQPVPEGINIKEIAYINRNGKNENRFWVE